MATQEQIEALKIDENVFELVEDTEVEYLVYFVAPFTGSDKCLVPKGTAFVPPFNHFSIGDIWSW